MRGEGIEFHPMPEEPDKHETPAAKNARLRPEREQRLQKEKDSEWQKVSLDEPEKTDEKKAA